MEGATVRDDAAAAFLLAEAIHEGDARGAVRGTLGGSLAGRVREAAAALEGLDRERRVERLRAVALLLRPAPSERDAVRRLPRRALALLAPSVSREVGQGWLAGVSPHRAGYQPPADLLAYLRRVAAPPPPPVLAAEERAWPA